MVYTDIKKKIVRLEQITREASEIIEEIDKYREKFIHNGRCNIPIEWIKISPPQQDYFKKTCEALNINSVGDLIKVPKDDFLLQGKRVGKLTRHGINIIDKELREINIEWN